MMRIEKNISAINEAINRLEAKKKRKFELNEPVMFRVKGRTFKAFVSTEGQVVEGRICYGVTMLEPVYPGSAVLHTFNLVPESQLKK
jgi:hypothetical protein